VILPAQAAVGETFAANSYNTWQWNGFSRSSWVPVYLGDSAAAESSLAAFSTSPSATSLTATSLDAVAAASTGGTTLSGVGDYDANGNGVRESTDFGVSGADVSITLAGSGSALATTYTGSDGSYTFSNLAAGNYTVTLLTPGSDPEQPTVGTLTDASGNTVSTGAGTISGMDSITDVQLSDGDTGANYDFPQLTYPYQLLSKRMLLNSTPGVANTTPIPPPIVVPEPSSFVLLVVAGLLLSGLRRRLV
jgi:hypothetical protein